jgi:polysaccharide biosynthesis protein PslH
LVYALEGRKVRRLEQRLARSFDFCTVISGNELETLRAYGTGARMDWFPNGVDLEYFSPRAGAYDPDLVVFVGRMDYYPNERAMLWFCEAVWPKLRERRASLKLRIIGANPPRAVRRLARIDGVEVTGFVADVRPYVRPAAVSVAPLGIARGMQNKILECMAMGVPVITTERVARGLGLGRESPLRVASAPQEYVETILAYSRTGLKDPASQARHGADRAASFSWNEAMRKLDEIIDAVCDRKAMY